MRTTTRSSDGTRKIFWPPFPLAATFDIASGVEPYASVRLKLGQTTHLRAIVKADGQFYTASKEVKVTVGGCG